MAKGLGFSDPQYTSLPNPEGNPNLRRRQGPQPNQKYLARRTPYQWQMQMGSSYGYGEYNHRRGKANNDSGNTPGAYLNFIER
jgi:hypothetical protein